MKRKKLLFVGQLMLVFLLSACTNEKSVLSSSSVVSSTNPQSSEVASSSQESVLSSVSESFSSEEPSISSEVSSEVPASSDVSSEAPVQSSEEPVETSSEAPVISSEVSSEEISSSVSESVSSSEEPESKFITSVAGISDHIASKKSDMTLDQFTNRLEQMDPQPLSLRKVRYTYHIVEKLTGIYQEMLLDNTPMQEGEIVGDFVSEPKSNNNDSIIKVLSGTPVTRMQKFYAMEYTSAINPSGWLSYHKTRRSFLQYAQEGEGFEESFSFNPTKLWMITWGNRPANASIDGTYFGFQEYERDYDDDGYCTSFMFKEYTYMSGTLSSYNSSRYYDGSYECTCYCTIEYLDVVINNESIVASSLLPKKEEGVSLETFTEEIDKLEPQTNDRKIRISYHIVESLKGFVPNATDRRGNPLPEGETVTDLVLESRNNSASDLKIVSGQINTKFSQICQSGIMIGIKSWLSYHKEKRNNAEREAQPGWDVFNESLIINPFSMWMVYAGDDPANSDVEGTYFAFEEYERTFDENGYCQTLRFRECTLIDGVFSRWDTKPQSYKGLFDAEMTATIEYLDVE